MPRSIATNFVFNAINRGRGVEETEDQIDDLNQTLDDTADKADKSSRSSNLAERAFGALGKAAGAAGKLVAGGLAVGLGAAVAGVTTALNEITDLNGAMNTFSARTGISGDQLDKFEGVAKDVFRSGWGDDLQDVVGTMGEVNAITGAVGDTLGNLTRDTEIFTDTFETDVSETIRTADTVMENFGKNGTDTFDLLTKAMQSTGDPGDDLLDTFNEYSGNFAEMGFTAEEMFGILESGLQAGARNTDDIADGMREFGIRLKDGSSDLALWSLGLDDLKYDFKQGEASGEDMFDAVIAGLRDIEDPLERNRLGVELFGTKWEDLGEEAFLALDKTSDSLDDMEGATQRAGNALQRGPAAAFERFQRRLRVGLMNALGPFIEKGLNLMVDGLDDLSEMFDTASGALRDLFGIARKFGTDSPQFFGMLTKYFGPEQAQQIQQYVMQIENALNTALAIGERVAGGLVNLAGDLIAAFQDGGLEGVGRTLLNKIVSGLGDLAAWGKEHIVDPVVEYLGGVDWGDVQGKLVELLGKLLSTGLDIGQKIYELAVLPVIEYLKEVSWGDVAGDLFNLYKKLLSTELDIGQKIYELAVLPVIEYLKGVDWGSIPGKLDDIFGSLLSGDRSLTQLLSDEVWTPLTTGLGDNTSVQEIATKAGEIGGKILSGLAEGIVGIATFVPLQIIDVIKNALSGGGGGEGEGGVEDSGKSLGESILSGIASAFVNIVSWAATNVIDPFIVGLTGDSLAGLVTAGTGAAANFLAGFAQSIADTDWAATAEGFAEFGVQVLTFIIDALSGLGTAIIDLINGAVPDQLDLGSFDLGYGVKLDLGSIDLPDNPVPGGSRDVGGSGYPGMAYQIGKGPYTEYYIPDVAGQFVPGNQLQPAMAGAGGGNGLIIQGDLVLQGVRNVREIERDLDDIRRRKNQQGRSR